jgi:hypothetical protein
MWISEFGAELKKLLFHGTRRDCARTFSDLKGNKMDKIKIEVIEKLEFLIDVKGMRSFLDHYGFYRRFIKNFSQIVNPWQSDG